MTPFIVAEMSANHLGSLKRAMLIVEAAAKAGADGLKLQTWLPGTMCVSDYVVPHGPWAGRKLRELYEQAHTPWAWHESIFRHARSLGLEPFSAAFDCESVDFLETLGVKYHKAASFEIVDVELLRHMGSKGKPVIISLGAARNQHEALDARAIAHVGGAESCVMLECVSEYPARPRDFRRLMGTDLWGVSDHSLGVGVSCAAAAHGAIYIEKHLTLSRADGGPDAAFSAEPSEFATLVVACKEAAQTRFQPSTSQVGRQKGAHPLRRSLWVTRPIERGEQIVLGLNVRTARPALGLPCDTPVTGRGAARALKAGEPLTQECLL